MPEGLILEFDGVGRGQYEAVNAKREARQGLQKDRVANRGITQNV